MLSVKTCLNLEKLEAPSSRSRPKYRGSTECNIPSYPSIGLSRYCITPTVFRLETRFHRSHHALDTIMHSVVLWLKLVLSFLRNLYFTGYLSEKTRSSFQRI
jgi:hypothetical protein